MKNIFLFIGLFGFCAMASGQDALKKYLTENEIETEAKEEGILKETIKGGKGKQPKAGDYIMVEYACSLLDGTVFDHSIEGEPFVFQVGYRQVIRGMDKGSTYLKQGEKAKLYLPANVAYGKSGAGKVPANSSVILEMTLVKILSDEEYDQYMIDLEEKERKIYEKAIKTQFLKDKKDIQDYCLDNKIKARRLPSGVHYAITKKGKGNNAKAGKRLKVSYEGALLDGTVFQKSDKPYEFELGKGKVIAGWEESLVFFNKNSEGLIIVPSKLAYGPREIKEDGLHIPGNSVLVFKIKVVEIK